jgi:hypothetical protein
MIASTSIALIQVLLTPAPLSARGARTGEISYKIIASPPIKARIWVTVINIELALGTHESLGTVTAICRPEVVTSGSIKAGIRAACIRLVLAV